PPDTAAPWTREPPAGADEPPPADGRLVAAGPAPRARRAVRRPQPAGHPALATLPRVARRAGSGRGAGLLARPPGGNRGGRSATPGAAPRDRRVAARLVARP